MFVDMDEAFEKLVETAKEKAREALYKDGDKQFPFVAFIPQHSDEGVLNALEIDLNDAEKEDLWPLAMHYLDITIEEKSGVPLSEELKQTAREQILFEIRGKLSNENLSEDELAAVLIRILAGDENSERSQEMSRSLPAIRLRRILSDQEDPDAGVVVLSMVKLRAEVVKEGENMIRKMGEVASDSVAVDAVLIQTLTPDYANAKAFEVWGNNLGPQIPLPSSIPIYTGFENLYGNRDAIYQDQTMDAESDLSDEDLN